MSMATSPRNVEANRRTEKGSHHQRLVRLGDQERQRRLTIVAMAATSTAILLAGLLGVLDFHYEVASPIRLIAWVVIAVVVAGLAGTLRPWLAFDSNDAVCETERAWPEIGQRLRTSYDYQATPGQVSPADPELVRALETDTQQRVTTRVIQPLGRAWPIFALLALCGAAAIIWLSALVAWPEWRVATARLMFVPAEYSNVVMEPLASYVPLGEDLEVRLHVEGRPLQTARVLYRTADEDDWKDARLKPADSGAMVGDLAAVLPDCQQDLQVQVEAGPFASGILSVAVRVPLILQEWKAKVQPPAYTGLPVTQGPPEGLRIPEGSRLQLAATYNRSPSQIDVGLTPQIAGEVSADVDEEVAFLAVDAGRAGMDLSIHAAAADGMTDDSSLHIEVVPDREPQLKFVAPETNAEAIPTAELRFTLEAFDDHGLADVGIRYRVDDGEEQALWILPGGDATTALAHTVTLPLEDLDLKYPQAITYYAYATDNREPEAQRATSELRFIDIRPFSRQYEFKDSQCSGNCQGECLTLEKLIKQQREILGRTFVVAQQDQAASELGPRLAREERELRTRTLSLASALEQKVGPMPTLHSAADAMSAAMDHLADQAIAEGQIDQESALADLVATRQNLRKILNLNNSQSQMCRNVDQQQIDKLRKPEQDREQQQEQQLAEIRKQLDQLANKQESFCQSAESCRQASQPAAARESLVQQQQQSAAKAAEIQQELESGKFGQLAPKRAKQAAESIQRSGESLARTDADEQSIAQARTAADQLQRLSDHLGRRHHPDFADKLAAAGRQAERLSQEQQQLNESLSVSMPENTAHEDPDRRSGHQAAAGQGQQQLADRTEELTDLVDQLQAESTTQEWQTQRVLTQKVSANSPREATAAMRQANEFIDAGRIKKASEPGRRASETLKRLASGLNEVQHALGPARLDELVKAEQRAAALLKDLQRAGNPAQRAMAQAGTRQLADTIRRLARGDAELTVAAQTLDHPAGGFRANQSSRDLPRNESSQLAGAPTTLIDGLRMVDEVLQRRIQEAILSGSLQQSVGAVPPQYSEMVDEYYRALSNDVE